MRHEPDPAVQRIAAQMERWLDEKQPHLGGATRREKIEELLINEMFQVRAQAVADAKKENRRIKVRDALLYAGIGTTTMTVILNGEKVIGLLPW